MTPRGAIDPERDGALLRIVGWLFGCSHHAAVEVDGHAVVLFPVRCHLRGRHRGPHFYGAGRTPIGES